MKQARARRRRRGWWRVGRWALVVILVGIAAGVAAFYSGWGQSRMRRAVETALTETVKGSAAIEGLDVSLFGEARARDLYIRDEEDQVVIHLESAALDVDLTALLRGKLVIPSVEVDGATIYAEVSPDGVLNVSDIFDVEDVEYTQGRPVILRDVALHDGRFYLRVDGAEQVAIDDIELHGSGYITAFNKSLTIDSGHVRWRDGDVDASVSGQLYIDPYLLLAREIAVESRDSDLYVRSLASDFQTGRTEAVGHLHLDAGEIALACERGREALPTLDGVCEQLSRHGLPDVDVAVAASHKAGAFPWFVRAWIEGKGQGVRVGVDTSLYVGTTWPSLYGSVSGTATVESERVQGTATTSVEAYAAGDRVVGFVDTTTPRGRGQARLRAHLADDTVWIDELRAQARIPDLAALTGGAVAGAAEIERLDVSGAWDALDVQLAAQVEDLRFEPPSQEARRPVEVEIGRAAVDIDASGVGADKLPRSGAVAVTIGDIRYGEQRVQELAVQGEFSGHGDRWSGTIEATEAAIVDSARVRVTLVQRDDTVRASLHRYELVTGGLRWQGRDSVIRRDSASGRTRIEDLAVLSSAGYVAVDGTLGGAAGARRPGDDRLRVVLENMDLGKLGRLFDTALAGSVTGVWRLRGGRRHWLIDGDAQLRQVAWKPNTQPVSGSLSLRLGEERLALELGAAVPADGGELSLELATAVPDDPFDVAGWQRFELDWVEDMRLSVRSVDIPKVAELLARPEVDRLAGEVSGTVAFSPESRELAVDLAAQGLALRHGRRPHRPVAARVTGTWNADELTGQAALLYGQEPTVTADFAWQAGLPELVSRLDGDPGDPGEYAQAVPVRVDVSIEDFDLHALAEDFAYPSYAGVDTRELSGYASGQLALRGTLAEPRLTIREVALEDLYIDKRALGRVSLAGEVRGQQASLTATAVQPAGGSLGAEVRYGQPSPSALRGRITARDYDLTVLRLLAPRRSSTSASALATVSGMLGAELEIGGTLQRPRIVGKAQLDDGQVWLTGRSRRVHDITASLEFQPERVKIRELSAMVDQGRVRATGQIELVDYKPRGFTAEIESRELMYYTPEYTTKVWTTTTLDGRYDDDLLSVDVRISPRTRVAIDESDRSLQSVDALPDVVYVDERAARELAGAGEQAPALPEVVVRITAPGGIRVVSEDINAVIRPRPRLTMRLKNGELASITGALVVTSGSVVLFEHKYRVEYGDVEFAGLPTNPSINIRLMSEFPAATVFVEVAGSVEQPEVTLSSTPPADETTILAIMLGQDPGESEEALAAGAVGIGTLLASKLRTWLPVRIDVVRTHPDGVSIGRWISSQLLLGYRYRATPGERENANEATLRWRFSPNWLLEGHYGDKDIGGLDVLWHYRF